MPRKTKTYRPSPINLDNVVSVRVVRGPHPKDTAAGVKPKDARWYWRAFVAGACVEVLGWVTEEEARRKGGEHVQTYAAEEDRTPKAVGGTFVALVQDWRDYMLSRQDAAVRTKKNAKQNADHLLDHWPDVKVSSVRAKHVQEYVNARISEGVAESTLQQELRAAGAAWRWGQEEGRAPARRFPKVQVNGRQLEDRKREKYTPPQEDVDAVLDHLPRTWRRMALALINECGARASGIQGMTWDDVDWTGKRLRVGKKTGKRWIEASDHILAELAAFRAMPAEGRLDGVERYVLGVSPKNVPSKLGGYEEGAIGDVCRDLGIKPFTPHGMRRLVVRRLRKGGVPAISAAEYLGHSVKMMQELYDSVDAEDRSERRSFVNSWRGDTDSVSGTQSTDNTPPRTVH